jgi:hypothetical protein
MSETTQRAQILSALCARGWELAETLDTEWWADEMIVLRSNWSPVGTTIVITFLVDPLHDGRRVSGESVWAVVASRKRPTDRALDKSEGLLLSFGSGWQSRLADFIGAVDALRE